MITAKQAYNNYEGDELELLEKKIEKESKTKRYTYFVTENRDELSKLLTDKGFDVVPVNGALLIQWSDPNEAVPF